MVIQPTLQPYMHNLGPEFSVPNTDSPLLALRVTTLLPSRTSVLGIDWSHVLGDGAAANLFIRHLSQLYVDPESVLTDYPTFSPHINLTAWPPSTEAMAEYDITQIHPVSLEDMAKGYGAAAAASQTLIIRLSAKDQIALIAECKKELEAGERLSDQDILSGWWIGLLERSGTKIRSTTYSVNVSKTEYRTR